MPHRYFANDPDDFVQDACEGLVIAHPTVSLSAEPLFLFRTLAKKGKVAVVSGGGTGHEPMHAGFVGTGMLDAAVPGAVFASPTAIQVDAATRKVAADRGVLHIVKNYTGDVLNFAIAAELSSDAGVEVQCVLVDDDLATDIAGSAVGRRGTAAALVVEKVCGAAAESGATLSELVAIGQDISGRTRSMALALQSCTHPGTGKQSFVLAAEEVEIGVGIHGERGRNRIAFTRADDLVYQLVTPICEAMQLRRGDAVIAVVNGLGSTHLTEQYIVTRAVHRLLGARGVDAVRLLAGSYVTALDMSGVSVTLVNTDEKVLRYWDAPVMTPALRW